jgi:hypothetical protein
LWYAFNAPSAKSCTIVEAQLERYFCGAWAVLLLGVTLAGCACKSPVTEDIASARILALNQSGEWDKAAKAARQYLDAGLATSLDDECQVYHCLIYANVRLGNLAEARAILSQFDQQCGELPVGHWVSAETDNLRVELGLVTVEPLAGTHDDGFWETADGVSLGLDAHALEEHRALCEETRADACLVVYKGKIVQEWYSPRYHTPMYAMSSTKSVTGILTGMLIDDGKIASIDDSVCTYIPEWVCGGERPGHPTASSQHDVRSGADA